MKAACPPQLTHVIPPPPCLWPLRLLLPQHIADILDNRGIKWRLPD